MNNDGTINFEKLEEQLLVAVEEDAKYKRENDAKFRAVAQRVGSYEEFKDIVAASHLKPLEKKDKEGLHNRKQPWNPYANQQCEKKASSQRIQEKDVYGIPKNSYDFQKFWRAFQKDQVKQYGFLINTKGSVLGNIFKAEIPMGLLGEFLNILNKNWKQEDALIIFDILDNISQVKRFNLSLQFLNKQERDGSVDLFEKLKTALIFSEMKNSSGSIVDEKLFIALKLKYDV
ncbi:coiled-coil domain-containing protein 103-like [Xenia sp. Carnegie-2017]|uniref:coiled-coil domain-containing protein 103-like n=1 Tax=Xenia sp. Carnegie-2017 TaxID=2897299 RepID=UPI001F04627A|nr:coiled-coil domain-containing protein 103-like [Xenia sp. Carnegie-2017]